MNIWYKNNRLQINNFKIKVFFFLIKKTPEKSKNFLY